MTLGDTEIDAKGGSSKLILGSELVLGSELSLSSDLSFGGELSLDWGWSFGRATRAHCDRRDLTAGFELW